MNFGLPRHLIDRIMARLMKVFTFMAVFTLIVIIGGLVWKSLPILKAHSLSDILFSTEWHPQKGKFGFLPFIISTIYVTGLSLVIAVPLCLLAAIYLFEYAPKKTLSWISPIIDILAGIPSVIFGVWGIIMIVPLVRDYIGPFFGYETTGYTVLTGGIVLAIMVFPIVIHILLEVFKTVPADLKNASLSLGATKWYAIRTVMLRKSAPGIISAIVLGLSRAFGETLAVLMVVGNKVQIPTSPLDAGYPIPALIANNYGETFSIPLYDSALLLGSLILFIITTIFILIARYILKNIEKKIA